MKTPVALINLWHAKVRTSVALSGIIFAIMMIFIQLGFYGSIVRNATRIHDVLNFDIVVTSTKYVHASNSGEFPRSRLYQAQAVRGVASAVPLYVGRNAYRNPVTGSRRLIVIVGFNPRDKVLRIPEVAPLLEELKRPDTALIDVLAQPEFGPREPGTRTELTDYGHRRVELVGQFELGLGFIAYGMLVVTDQNFARMIEGRSLDEVSLGLITVSPGADPAVVARRLKAALPEDVQVLARPAAERREQDYWTKATSTGVVFGSGVLVACSVGMVVIYNVLSGEVMSRKAEFATLKAMGYSDRFLSVVVIQQALLFAIVGYLAGFVSALGFYANTRAQTHVPIMMDLPIAGTALALTLGMCLGSALVAVRKFKFADPADLF